MLALRPDIVEAVWQAVAGHLPEREKKAHPLGCHRGRVPNRDCFEAILFRLVTGCSWDVAGRLGKGGETTLRRRRDEWLEAGVFDALVAEALHAYDRVIGLDLSEVAIDGSLHKGPVAARGQDRAQSIGEKPTGSGRSPPIASASRSAGRQTGRTATTRSFCRRHLETSHPGALSKRSRRFTSTAAMTTTSCAPTSPVSASTISSAREREHRVRQRARRRACRSGCAGRSSGRTHGCRTSAGSGATPTASSPSDSLSSLLQSPLS